MRTLTIEKYKEIKEKNFSVVEFYIGSLRFVGTNSPGKDGYATNFSVVSQPVRGRKIHLALTKTLKGTTYGSISHNSLIGCKEFYNSSQAKRYILRRLSEYLIEMTENDSKELNEVFKNN